MMSPNPQYDMICELYWTNLLAHSNGKPYNISIILLPIITEAIMLEGWWETREAAMQLEEMHFCQQCSAELQQVGLSVRGLQ